MTESKTIQVLKVQAFGKHYTVIRMLNAKYNPFWLYEHSWTPGRYGYRDHKRLVEKYQTLESCLRWLVDNVPEFRN